MGDELILLSRVRAAIGELTRYAWEGDSYEDGPVYVVEDVAEAVEKLVGTGMPVPEVEP